MNNIIEKLDKILVNMKYDENVVYKQLVHLGDFFHSQKVLDFCIKHSKNDFFTNSKNAYHNGLHTARVLACLNFLIYKEDKLQIEDTQNLLVAAMFHDFKHLGKTNEFFAEQELIAANEFVELAMESNVFEQKDIEIIREIIFSTEVSINVQKALDDYKKMKMENYDSLIAMKALMAEADILSSLTHECGFENGHLLADELSNSGFATDKGRQYFLNTLEFVTQASEKMGIADYLEEEKKQIAQKVKMKP